MTRGSLFDHAWNLLLVVVVIVVMIMVPVMVMIVAIIPVVVAVMVAIPVVMAPVVEAPAAIVGPITPAAPVRAIAEHETVRDIDVRPVEPDVVVITAPWRREVVIEIPAA